MKRFGGVLLAVVLLLGGCGAGEDSRSGSISEQEAVGEAEPPAAAESSEEPPAPSEDSSLKESSEEELEPVTMTAEQAGELLAPGEGGVVEITTAEQLMALSALVASGDTGHASMTYVQRGKISLQGYNFIPIGSVTMEDLGYTPAEPTGPCYAFLGTYDGGGHIVAGLTVRNPQQECGVGLFGHVGPGAAVKNVHVTGGNIAGGFAVGGVAGAVEGTLYNCSFNGSVLAVGERAGGIAGQLVSGRTEGAAGRLENCFSNAEVGAPAYVGGFCGLAMPGTAITDSYALGKVTVKDIISEKSWIAGGFLGEGGGEVSRCFSNTEVYAEVPAERVGGFAGSIAGTVGGCYFNKTATENWKDIGKVGDGLEPGVTSCTVAELVEQDTYAGWDFAVVWEIDGEHNRGLPFLRSAELY